MVVLPPERHWEAHQYDEPSVATFDAKTVRTARELETQYMRKLMVYQEAAVDEMRADRC